MFDVIAGSVAKLSAVATQGYVWLPTSDVPTGAPAFDGNNGGYTGARRAILLDDTNFRFYAYLGGAWRFASFDNGSSSGITQLVGDAQAGPGTGVQTLTILPNVVTLAKMQQIATNSLLGRSTAGTGNVEVITVGSGLTLTGGTLTSTSSGGTITALTGDVTASGSGSVTATIAAGAVTTSKIAALNITTALLAAASVTTAKVANNAVTYALIQTQADQTILGNVSGGTASPSALTKSQVLALLNSGLATGILGVTATSGTLNSSPIASGLVPFGTGVNSLGVNSNFGFDTGTSTMTIPIIEGPSASLLLKDSPTDNTHLNFNSAQIDVKGSFIPTAASTFTLGSAARAWLTVTANTIQGPSASLTLQDSPTVNTQLQFLSSGIEVKGDLVPLTNLTYSLGTSSHEWLNAYVQDVYGNSGGTILTLHDSASDNVHGAYAQWRYRGDRESSRACNSARQRR